MNTCKVSGPECIAPAGFGVSGFGFATGTTSVGRTKCYICGEPVCLECSSLMAWYGHRVRACDDCRENETGEEVER